MNRIRLSLILCLSIIMMLSGLLPVFAAQTATQTMPEKCLDQYGTVRTDLNSVNSDFCFLPDKTMTYISWGEFKLYKNLGVLLNQTDSLSLANPTTDTFGMPLDGSATQDPSVIPPDFNQLSADPTMLDEGTTIPGDSPTMPDEGTPQDQIMPDPSENQVMNPEESQITPDFNQLSSGTPEPSDQLPLNPVDETNPMFLQPLTETPTPTVETPIEEEPPQLMMLSVPLVGTITDITGVSPAQGEVVNSAVVDFSWYLDAVGVDTVQTSFVLNIDGVNYTVTPTCGLDSCNTTRTVTAGIHTWFVTGKAGTVSVSSNPISFSVVLNAVAPSKPVLFAPSGVQTSKMLTMQWIPATNVDSYQLAWSYSGGNGTASLPGTDASCLDGLCSLPLTFPSVGDYAWTVTAANAHGNNASLPMNFTIAAPAAAPAKAVLVMPDGSYTSPSVNFVWKPVPNAEAYAVVWVNQWGETKTLTLLATDATCLAGDCHVEDILPTAGSYTWYVITANTAGTSQSDSRSFSLSNQLSVPTANTPRGAVGNAQPFTYVFSKIQDNVYEYNVKVWEAYSNNQVADYYWNVSDLNCGPSTCSGLATSTLPQGYYYWKVRARSNNSVSDWSSASHFNNLTFTPTPAPSTIPYAYAPSGVIYTATPTFSWRAITGASAYWLTIYDGNGRVIHSASTNSSVCDYRNCSFNPGFTLPANGNYSWRIAGGAWNGTVWGVSSAAFSYQGQPVRTIVPEILPTDLRIVYPKKEDVMKASEAKIVWLDAFDKNERFLFTVHSKDGTELLKTELDRESAWCDRTICTIAFENIPVADDYRFELIPMSKSGNVGNPIRLTIDISDQDLEFGPVYPMDNESVSAKPIFSWRLPSGTDKETQKNYVYTVKLDNRTRSMEAILGPFTCESAGLTCFEGGAFLTLTEPLTPGEYRWGVSVQQLDSYTEPVTFRIP